MYKLKCLITIYYYSKFIKFGYNSGLFNFKLLFKAIVIKANPKIGVMRRNHESLNSRNKSTYIYIFSLYLEHSKNTSESLEVSES